MQIGKAVRLYLTYLEGNTRPNSVRSFAFTLSKFAAFFPGQNMADIAESDIIEFASWIAKDRANATKSNRVSVLRAFFNFIIETTEAGYSNPCSRPMVKKLYRMPRGSSPDLLDKDTIDEIIFRTVDERNRLVLELMGRAGMRVGEVLNIRPSDIDHDNATILIQEPKSGRAGERVYITKKLCSRLLAYIAKADIARNDNVFDISYSTAYRLVRQSGMIVGAPLRPHDLRRHAATQASRNSIPLEIVSKVILRHADIATTQRYLGTVNQEEASRWVEHLNR